MTKITTEALDALIAEHRFCSCWGENCGIKARPKADWNAHCSACLVSAPCTAYLLATEVRDARKVVADVVVTERDAKYAYFVCRMCGGMWRDDEPNGHRENCAVGAYDRVMEAIK